jgi:predicted dehydrogenase
MAGSIEAAILIEEERLFMTDISRRRVLRAGAAAFTAASYNRILGANETIQVGVIGTGVRGGGHVRSLANQEGARIVGLCDVWLNKAERHKVTATDAAVFQDHRKLLEMNSLDAVLIATPDHWHVPVSMDSIGAGKDVFCEKPITLKIGEAEALKKAIQDRGRVFQSGMQQRSMTHFKIARDEYIRAGKLGRVTLVRTWWHGSVSSFVKPIPPELRTRPADLDWKRFVDPVSKTREYHPYQYNCFRAFFDFGGGQFTDLFTHWVDAAHMLIGEDIPNSANASGGQYIPELQNDGSGRTIPDTVSAVLTYPGGWACTFEATMAAGIDANGLEFCGTKGKLYITRAGFEFTPVDPSAPAGSGGRGRGGPSGSGPFTLQTPASPLTVGVRAEGGDQHIRNWLDCIKSRKTPNATVVDGIRAAAACHLCSSSYLQGRRLKFDPAKERIVA